MSMQEAVDGIWDSRNSGVLDELNAFGQILLNEVQQRSAQLDTRLATMLGLSGGIMAFLLIGNELWSTAPGRNMPGLLWYRIGLAVAVVFGLICILFCYLGLRIREWPVPSESDWLNRQLFNRPDDLKRFHIISLLETHHSHNRLACGKARWTRYAETALAAAACVLAFTLMARLIQQLFS